MNENKKRLSEITNDSIVSEMNKLTKAMDNVTIRLKELSSDEVILIGKMSAKLRNLQIKYNALESELKRRKNPQRNRRK